MSKMASASSPSIIRRSTRLGPGVSDGIIAALEKGEADPSVKAMVLMGAGRTFIAGADIRGFGKPRAAPTKRTYDVLDQGKKPVVAAIHGYALGGGLENALACHYRIAVPSAKVGLPEVQIGILPGGGGTQRLPRLIGPKIALDMIVSGRHVPADEAKSLGIVDEIIPGKDLRNEAIAWAKKIADKRPLPRVRDRSEKLAEAKSDPGMFDAARKNYARSMRGQPAPEKCIQAVRGRRASSRSTRALPPSGASFRSSRTHPKRSRCAMPSSPSARSTASRASRRI